MISKQSMNSPTKQIQFHPGPTLNTVNVWGALLWGIAKLCMSFCVFSSSFSRILRGMRATRMRLKLATCSIAAESHQILRSHYQSHQNNNGARHLHTNSLLLFVRGLMSWDWSEVKVDFWMSDQQRAESECLVRTEYVSCRSNNSLSSQSTDRLCPLVPQLTAFLSSYAYP